MSYQQFFFNSLNKFERCFFGFFCLSAILKPEKSGKMEDANTNKSGYVTQIHFSLDV